MKTEGLRFGFVLHSSDAMNNDLAEDEYLDECKMVDNTFSCDLWPREGILSFAKKNCRL